MSIANSQLKQSDAYPFIVSGCSGVSGGYAPGCAPFNGDIPPCNVNPGGLLDWAFVYNCNCNLSNGLFCSQVDTNLCPIITGLPPTPTWVSNIDAGWNGGSDDPNPLTNGRLINCPYLKDNFNTPNAVLTWLDTFGIDGSPNFDNPVNANAFNDVIMPHYCGLFTTECKPYPITATGGTACTTGRMGCSNLNSTKTDVGCRVWFNTLPPPERDAFIGTFCETGGGTGNTGGICANDCLCANRADDLIYQAFESASPPTLDACWYKPCQQSEQYLIPSPQIILPGSCPSTICQQNIFIEGGTGNNVNINIAKATISCQIGGTGGNGPVNPVSFWEAFGIYILLGGFILLFIIIGIVIYSEVVNTSPNPTT